MKGKVILKYVDEELRTDESFRCKRDKEHHLSDTPLLKLNIGLVTCFPIDYMHNVCLRVTRKLLTCRMNGDLYVRLSRGEINTISEKMVALKKYFPQEINRKPRPLSEIARFKATEFRSFLLYLGPVVLAETLNVSFYEHFLLFHFSIVILCSDKHISNHGCELVSKMLKTFVNHCEHLYSPEFMVYNVHSLIHLPTDVEKYGQLYNFSAFPFENFLGQLSRLVKSPKEPLV